MTAADETLHPPPSLRRRAGQVLTLVMLALFAVLTLGSGLDRVSAGNPAATPTLAHWPFDPGYALSYAHNALLLGDYETARRKTIEAVRTSPLDPHAVGTLGYTDLMTRRPDDAKAAFSVSRQLGWRDTPTEVYWFDASIALGDMPVAVRHLSAMLRLAPDLWLRDRLIAQVAQYEQGRDALAAELRTRPGWERSFLVDFDRPNVIDLDARADVARRVGRGLWTCDEIAGLVDRLRPVGLLEDSRMVWDLNCPRHAGYLNDGNLDRLDHELPFIGLGWRLTRTGDVTTSVTDAPGGGHMLSADVSGVTTRVLIQPTILDPGEYRLIWRMPDTDARNRSGLTGLIDCDQDLANALTGTPVPGENGAYYADFAVSDDCPSPFVTFWLQPHHPVSIAKVRLARISDTPHPREE